MIMKEEFNPEDYQGRSKDHVERNYRIFSFVFVILWLAATYIFIYALIKSLT